jgi:hypothetical protein
MCRTIYFTPIQILKLTGPLFQILSKIFDDGRDRRDIQTRIDKRLEISNSSFFYLFVNIYICCIIIFIHIYSLVLVVFGLAAQILEVIFVYIVLLPNYK